MQVFSDAVAPHPGIEDGGAPAVFLPVPESFGTWAPAVGGPCPVVLRGAARHWPALERWTFPHLAECGGPRPVTLVHGNRELGATLFSTSTWSDYLARLDAADGNPDATGHLKEFDLFEELPALAQDAPVDGLFPPGQAVVRSAWIGPQAARTGLHYDLVDNLAVLVRGAKRFQLARPGTVEALGALSRKYDRWARLARIGMRDLAGEPAAAGALFQADLGPGDAIYVPRGWWHEVSNLRASVFVSGFFGPASRLRPLSLATGARQFLHDISLFGRRHGCTCHAGRKLFSNSPTTAP